MYYLVIEDDEVIRKILTEIFDIMDPDGLCAFFSHGNEAWSWLDGVETGEIEELPDIAFIDIRMPGYQGYEIAERMRAIPALSNIGIILMTAYELSEKDYEEITSRSQADRFIFKPLPGINGLNQIVQEIMDIRGST